MAIATLTRQTVVRSGTGAHGRGVARSRDMPKNDADDVPLISSRSPSYERAREERKHPSPTADPNLVAKLARQLEAHENARGAYLAGAEAASDEALRKRMEAAAGVHAASARALADRLTELGAAAPREGEIRQVLAHDREHVARAGGDAAIESALAAVEADLAGVLREG